MALLFTVSLFIFKIPDEGIECNEDTLSRGSVAKTCALTDLCVYVASPLTTHNSSITGDDTLNIQYNELNLPKQVTGTPVGTVSYTYNAGGSKLTKQTTSETRQYIDGIEYVGTAIDLLHTEAGIARNNGGHLYV